MGFSVTVLGSAAMYATRERAAAGYLLRLSDVNVWLDAGAGTWRNLLRHIDYPDLHAVVLTHRHPDHTTDVFQAHHAISYGPIQDLPKVPLWAPEEVTVALKGFSERMTEAFDLHPVAAGDSIEFAGGRFSFFHMAHPVVTLGVRVEFDRGVFAYTGDTGPGADFEGLIKGADVLICEATFQDSDGPWEGHMYASAAAELAERYGVARLVLTHLPPERDLGLSLTEAHRNSEGLQVELAEDNRTYEIVS
jgi:ribonuclease BN (tRNA processing enzyme)